MAMLFVIIIMVFLTATEVQVNDTLDLMGDDICNRVVLENAEICVTKNS